MRSLPVIVTAALLAVALPPTLGPLGAVGPVGPAQGQGDFDQCGDVTLIFMNPDLQVQQDGFVHASGTFFIQFQAIGERASEVAKMSFGFGKPVPEPLISCDPVLPVQGPPTGAYIPQYRTDSEARDGFFVPVNTTLVPDGEYGASVTAYDAAGNFISRFYTQAMVENGSACRTSGVCADSVQPWPMILPGDGEQTNDVGGITIEFAEFVQAVTVTINDVQVIPDPWTPPARDDDAVPDNDHEDCSRFGPLSEVNNAAPCHRVVYGSGFHIPREPQGGDVIKVVAIDHAGNEAEKVVTVGGATQGGAIELKEPELQLTAEATTRQVAQGASTNYTLKLTNAGTGEAEARMSVQAPENVTVAWSSPTVSVPSGETVQVKLDASAAQHLRPGRYTLVVKATYKSGTADKEQQLSLTLEVREDRPVPESPLRQARADNATADRLQGAEEDDPRDAPGPAAALVLLAAAMAAACAALARGGPRTRRR